MSIHSSTSNFPYRTTIAQKELQLLVKLPELDLRTYHVHYYGIYAVASLTLVTPNWTTTMHRAMVSQDSSQLLHIQPQSQQLYLWQVYVSMVFVFLVEIQLWLPRLRDEKLIPSRQHWRQQFGICRPPLCMYYQRFWIRVQLFVCDNSVSSNYVS